MVMASIGSDDLYCYRPSELILFKEYIAAHLMAQDQDLVLV